MLWPRYMMIQFCWWPLEDLSWTLSLVMMFIQISGWMVPFATFFCDRAPLWIFIIGNHLASCVKIQRPSWSSVDQKVVNLSLTTLHIIKYKFSKVGCLWNNNNCISSRPIPIFLNKLFKVSSITWNTQYRNFLIQSECHEWSTMTVGSRATYLPVIGAWTPGVYC